MPINTSNLASTIILEGVPIAYIVEVWRDATVPEDVVTVIESCDPTNTKVPDAGHFRLLFDNLSQISYKVNIAGSSDTTEKFEINLSDNKKIVFDKTIVSIDGVTGEVTATAGSTGSGLAEATLTLNGADLDSETFTDLLVKLNDSEASYFILAFPNGFTHTSKGLSKPDGWCYMFCKRTSNIELAQGNAPATLTVTFSAEKVPASWDDFSTELKGLDIANGIQLKPLSDGISIPPVAITTDAQVAQVAAGKMLIMKQPTV